MKPYSSNDLADLYDALAGDQKEYISNQLRLQTEILTNQEGRKKAKAKNPDHRVTGTIVFEFDDKEGQKIPIHNLYLELWDRDTTNPDDFLGQAVCDKDGNFEIWYDPTDAGLNDLQDLDLRIYVFLMKIKRI